MRHNRTTRLLTAREAAAYLGVSLYTLKKIERLGYFAPYRTPGGHRRYSHEMLDEYLRQSTEFTYNAGPPDPGSLDPSLDRERER
ncbi:MAG: helix-turn-helix domain-containing protein [Anaerolineae bacterium]|nr:helix-turn-helix domain-containing protein [Anaerolineae bacterium]NIO00213.1 helix-turn-helix domain-containing protein [Anaerolineae bacterium]NIQ82985.1 helix-turn-helix domain-containing protein [Anaerolineae bacterium]